MSDENRAWAAAFLPVGKLFSFLFTQKLTNWLISETTTFLPGLATIGRGAQKLLDKHALKHMHAVQLYELLFLTEPGWKHPLKTLNDCSLLCLRASWGGCNKGPCGKRNKRFCISCPVEQSASCFPPSPAIGSPRQRPGLPSPFGVERAWGAVRGAGSVPGRSASVKDWQGFLQFPFPWAASSNQTQSSPHYLPFVSLIVIWK